VPQSSSSYSHRICNNVTWFRNLNITDGHTRTHEEHGDVKSWILDSISSSKLHNMLCIIPYCLSVCLCVRFICWTGWPNIMIYDVIIWRSPNHRRLQFPTFSGNNKADTRICESVATQVSPTWRKSINVYWLWNITHCLQWCVFEVQGEEKFAVQLSVLGFVLEWKSQWMDVLINWHWMWKV
jgi:hypothetical protein